MEIKVLQPGDAAILKDVAPEVFDHPLDPDLTREFLNDSRHHIVVAIDSGTVVGFASGVHYIHPDKPPELWVNEIALAPTHRRRGLGKILLATLFQVGRTHLCKSAWVLTYRSNQAATALYEAIGGTAGADNSGQADDLIGYTFSLKN